MCFSATASFGSAAILTVAGAAATMINREPRRRLFVAIPFLFGAQQAMEGAVWMTLQRADFSSLHRAAVTGFLFFAYVVWPVWVPWSVRRLETARSRRVALGLFLGCGIFFASCALYVLAVDRPSSRVVGHCLDYSFEGDGASFFPPNLHALLYFSSTVLPFFASSRNWVKTTGALILGGLAVTLAFWKFAVTSVWCFFAALASFFICARVVRDEKGNTHFVFFSERS